MNAPLTSGAVLDLELPRLLARLAEDHRIPASILIYLRTIITFAWKATLKITNGNPHHPAWEAPSIVLWQTAICNATGRGRTTSWRAGKSAQELGLLEIAVSRVVMKSADECRRAAGNRYTLTGALFDIWRAMVAAYRACADPRVRAQAARTAAWLARENNLPLSERYYWPNQVFSAIAAGKAARPAAPENTSGISDAGEARPAFSALRQALETAAARGEKFAREQLARLFPVKDDPPDKV